MVKELASDQDKDTEDRLSLRFILNPGNAAFEPLKKMSRVQRYRMVKDILNKHFLMEKTGEAALLRQLLGAPEVGEQSGAKVHTRRVRREEEGIVAIIPDHERSVPPPAPVQEKQSVPRSPITLGNTNFM